MGQQMHYILVGYPFAGKTTLAKKLEKRFGFKRLSIDEVKFEFGYKDISDDDVPDREWGRIFDELDKRITENLKKGCSIINEYAWLTKKWRNRARVLATNLGIETKIIFINIPESVVRQRLQENRRTNKRFDIPDKVFNDAIENFEIPDDNENIVVYDPLEDMDKWIGDNF